MVTINGESKPIAGRNLLDYLKEVGFEPERIVVEKNRLILPREELGKTILQDGDEVEVLCFVGGG